MNKQTLKAYEAPVVEVIEVEVESGFATSGGSITGGMGESTGIGGNGEYIIP